MTILSTPRKKKSTDGLQARVDSETTIYALSLIDLTKSVKSDLLDSKDILVIHYPENQRQQLIGIIAQLRDELPIKSGWQTIRESHLSETRLRARRYRIDGAYLQSLGVK